MLLLTFLTTTLFVILFADAAFSEPTSPNDQFRAIALHVTRPTEPPVCCLKPLSPIEPVDDEILLSFEDWKAKQTAMQQAQLNAREREKDTTNRSGNGVGGANNGGAGTSDGTEGLVSKMDSTPSNSGSSSTSEDSAQNPMTEPLSPHFQVPLTDRFNYASLDCSARVHMAHRSAKSASSILSSKRDRYMLSPCKSSKQEKQFVVVELCDDVRIDTVQLANFEFFSGVFKDFNVSVAKTWSTGVDGWTLAGSYKAKNVRGVQSFHPPTFLRDFYRYIRIDFLTHYGNEYYCPVSLLRVYGLTHLEQWKWDIWEAESRAKQAELEKAAPPHPAAHREVVAEATLPAHITVSDISTSVISSSERSVDGVASSPPLAADTKAHTQSNNLLPSHGEPSSRLPPSTIPKTPSANSISPSITDTQNEPFTSASNHDHQPSHIPHDIYPQYSDAFVPSPSASSKDTSKSSSIIFDQSKSPSVSSTTAPIPNNHIVNPDVQPPPNIKNPAPSPHQGTGNGNPSSITPGSPTTIIVPPPPHPTVAAGGGGESIYRTIMNRLTALEANHTLYTRYIEQQNSAIRDVIKRLSEDVGRLEGNGRAQALMYQRSIQNSERQGRQLQMDYGQLMAQIEHLSEEIILEKRLGVAQLCLLLAVLIFMGLTRGSRGEPPFMEAAAPARINKSMREWGRRHLSFSGDWTNRFKRKNSGVDASRSRSPPRLVRPHPQTAKSHPPASLKLGDHIAFPTYEIKHPLEPIYFNTAPLPADVRSRTKPTPSTAPLARSRTPSFRTATARLRHPATPTRAVQSAIQRSNSHGAGSLWTGNVPKSAKKWARTAHLHEVRSAGRVRERVLSAGGRENRENEDVFLSPPPPHLPAVPTGPILLRSRMWGKGKEMDKGGVVPTSLDLDDILDQDGDSWVDTDSVDDGLEMDRTSQVPNLT